MFIVVGQQQSSNGNGKEVVTKLDELQKSISTLVTSLNSYINLQKPEQRKETSTTSAKPPYEVPASSRSIYPRRQFKVSQ